MLSLSYGKNKTEAVTRTLVVSSSEFSVRERTLAKFVHSLVTTAKYLTHCSLFCKITPLTF